MTASTKPKTAPSVSGKGSPGGGGGSATRPAPAAAAAAQDDRPLDIPPPAGRREEPVAKALERVRKKRRNELAEARRVIEQYGLTIEVLRLRDRLASASLPDTRRRLLATPGVPEALFLEAVREHLPDATTPPPDAGEIAEKVAAALEGPIGEALERPLNRLTAAVETLIEQLGRPGTGSGGGVS